MHGFVQTLLLSVKYTRNRKQLYTVYVEWSFQRRELKMQVYNGCHTHTLTISTRTLQAKVWKVNTGLYCQGHSKHHWNFLHYYIHVCFIYHIILHYLARAEWNKPRSQVVPPPHACVIVVVGIAHNTSELVCALIVLLTVLAGMNTKLALDHDKIIIIIDLNELYYTTEWSYDCNQWFQCWGAMEPLSVEINWTRPC